MNTEKIIYIHLGGTEETLACKLQGGLTLEAVALLVLGTGKLGTNGVEEIFFFEEDTEIELPRDHRFDDSHHGRRVHAHRCKEIKVTFLYADARRGHSFQAGATIGKLLHWAKSHFGGDQGGKYALRLSADGEPLPHAAHLGSYVKPGVCEITLYFSPTCRIQG